KRISWTPALNAAGTSPSSMRVVSTSNDTDKCFAVAYVSTAGCTGGSAAGVDATCFQASACATTAELQAYSASSDAHRANDVPVAGNATCCPARCWAQAMLRSSSKIRQDTPS